jgi:ferredoxin
MHIEYDRDTCIGMFQCVDEWDQFTKNLDDGKADLADAEAQDGVFVRDVPEEDAFEAEFAARVCPVDAIRLYDDEGEQVV